MGADRTLKVHHGSLERRRQVLAWSLGLAATALSLPIAVQGVATPFRFHQFEIHRLELRYGVLGGSGLTDWFRSSYGSGLNVLRGWRTPAPSSLDDERAMFEHVFAWLPPRAVVYPTEGFYYFSTRVAGRQVAGNLRVADLHIGRLSMAYFTVPEKRVWRLELAEGDGLQIQEVARLEYDVTFDGKTVRFVLPACAEEGSDSLRLLPEEELVGRIHDESGLRLFLLYNHETKSFYEILDEERGVTDTMDSIGDCLLAGRRTGFAFYEDVEYGRKILIGVPLENVKRNDYFDGPGDQVPFGLYLRDKLYEAYPNTLLGEGIDDHGVYLGHGEWRRIAISPYLRYSSITELQSRVASCVLEGSRSAAWTSLTKEWWNTPDWRRGILRKLELEGKVDPSTGEVRAELIASAQRK